MMYQNKSQVISLASVEVEPCRQADRYAINEFDREKDEKERS
jgi:hypothetical protein